ALAVERRVDVDFFALAGRLLDPELAEAGELLAFGGCGVHRQATRRNAVEAAATECAEVAGSQKRDQLVHDGRIVQRIMEAEACNARKLDAVEVLGLQRLTILEHAAVEV